MYARWEFLFQMQSNKISFLNACMFYIIHFYYFTFFYVPQRKFVHDQTLKPATCALPRLPVQFAEKQSEKDLHFNLFFLLCILHYFKCLSLGLICWLGYWITLQTYPHFAHNVLQPELWNRFTLEVCLASVSLTVYETWVIDLSTVDILACNIRRTSCICILIRTSVKHWFLSYL